MPRNVLKPTKADLAASTFNCVPDVIAPRLRVLFCGINPGLYSAWARHHFARPGNRFWPTLFKAGFTDRLLRPDEERELLPLGYGITNIVDRPSAAAAELNKEELVAGGAMLRQKVKRYEIHVLAVLGVTAYREAFQAPLAVIGPQPHPLGRTQIWVLPNPSGLNAHFTPTTLANLFSEFRSTLD